MAPSLHYLHTNTLLSQCAVSVASGYSTGNNEQPELTGALLGLKLVLYGLKSQQWRTTESQKEKKKKSSGGEADHPVTNRSFNKRSHIDQI